MIDNKEFDRLIELEAIMDREEKWRKHYGPSGEETKELLRVKEQLDFNKQMRDMHG